MSSLSKAGLNFSTAAGSLTSSWEYCKPSRCEPSSGEYSCALARVPQTATRAPLVRKAGAMPLPMPLEPPTTSTCLPLKSSSFIPVILFCCVLVRAFVEEFDHQNLVIISPILLEAALFIAVFDKAHGAVKPVRCYILAHHGQLNHLHRPRAWSRTVATSIFPRPEPRATSLTYMAQSTPLCACFEPSCAENPAIPASFPSTNAPKISARPIAASNHDSGCAFSRSNVLPNASGFFCSASNRISL